MAASGECDPRLLFIRPPSADSGTCSNRGLPSSLNSAARTCGIASAPTELSQNFSVPFTR